MNNELVSNHKNHHIPEGRRSLPKPVREHNQGKPPLSPNRHPITSLQQQRKGAMFPDENGKKYLPILVYSPTSMMMSSTEHHHRMLSYETMDDLHSKLNGLFLQSGKDSREDDDHRRDDGFPNDFDAGNFQPPQRCCTSSTKHEDLGTDENENVNSRAAPEINLHDQSHTLKRMRSQNERTRELWRSCVRSSCWERFKSSACLHEELCCLVLKA